MTIDAIRPVEPQTLSRLNGNLEGNDLKIILDVLQNSPEMPAEETTERCYEVPVQQIAGRVNLSTATVYKHLRSMTEKGKIILVKQWGRGRNGTARVYRVNV